MDWKTLLSPLRVRSNGNAQTLSESHLAISERLQQSADLRSEFDRDYHRIISSASFRRLQDKTQVFPLDKSDFIRTRLTHSLEVSSFARSLGHNIGESIQLQRSEVDFSHQMVEDMASILQCAGLIHDIGNPPFGHFAELSIREWFKNHLPHLEFFGRPIAEVLSAQMIADLYHFEGNAQALRLVSKLHYLIDENGMNLTFALLNTIIKYPVASTQVNPQSGNIKTKKMGYYLAERDVFQAVTEATGTGDCRHPLTFILEAADDLAYTTADIEDGFTKGFLSYHDLVAALVEFQKLHPPETFFDPLEKLTSLYERGIDSGERKPDSYAIKNWIVRVQGYLIRCATEGFLLHYDDIMAGRYTHDLFFGTGGEALVHFLSDLAYQHIFSSREIYQMEVAEQVILDFLLTKLTKAVLYYDTGEKADSLNLRMMSFFPDNYLRAYHCHAEGKEQHEKLYLRLLLVTDYICGMTDSYAKSLFQDLGGIS